MPIRIRGTNDRRPHFIKEWRKHRNLTQEQLASRLEVAGVEMSSASLSRVENNRQPYTQDLLEALANALQTDPASLLIRDPTDPDGIWSIWDNAKPGQRRQLVEIGKTLTKAETSHETSPSIVGHYRISRRKRTS